MGKIEALCREYERQVRLRWDPTLAGPQRVWFAAYLPDQERRLRLRIPLFEETTRKAGHGWNHVDLTTWFAQWMANHDYREAYFANPDRLELALKDFAAFVADMLRSQLESAGADDHTVVSVSGVGSLFGVARVSKLVEDVAGSVRGRLLVFFPGQHEGGNYRLLDARDGWNYLAVLIAAANGE